MLILKILFKLKRKIISELKFDLFVIIDFQSRTNILAKSRKIRQNWTRPESFDIPFYVSLNHQCQKLISGGETGNWTTQC